MHTDKASTYASNNNEQRRHTIPLLKATQKNNVIPDSARVTTECGLGRYRPKNLQRFTKPRWMLFWMCWFSLMQGIIVNGLVPSTLTSIERRYNLQVSVLGNIIQSYEIGYAIFCVPVAYVGGRHSKPLFLGIGLFLLATGSFVFSLPQILSKPYVLTEPHHDIGSCNLNNRRMLATEFTSQFSIQSQCQDSTLSWNQTGQILAGFSTVDGTQLSIQNQKFSLIFCLAQFLLGAGSAPLFTLAVTYIDESVGQARSSLYIAVFFTCLILGPAIGYSLTAVFSQVHVDFVSLESSRLIDFNESDPTWVGAWWVGFEILAIVSLFAVFPILSLPKVIPAVEKYNMVRQSVFKQQVMYNTSSAPNLSTPFSAPLEPAKSTSAFIPSHKKGKSLGASIPQDKQATSRFSADLANVVKINYLTTSIIESTEINDKKKGSFWQNAYEDLRHLPNAIKRVLTNASYLCITLAVTVEGMIVAALTGFMAKYLEKQFNMATSSTNLIIGFIMVPFAGLGTFSSGVVVNYLRLTCTKLIKYCILMSLMTALLTPMFMIYCKPTKLVGIEVGYDGEEPDTNASLPFQSTCNSHCKCSANAYKPMCATSKDGFKQFAYSSPCFAGCPEPYSPSIKAYRNCTCPPLNSTVTPGLCPVNCSALVIFLILFAPLIFCTFSIGVPALSVVLRCVDYEERPFALGIQWILVRCLGMIPAPVVFARLFEAACVVSKGKDCKGGLGVCYLYDNRMLANLFLTFSLVCKSVSVMFLILALIFFKRSGRIDTDVDLSDKCVNKSMA